MMTHKVVITLRAEIEFDSEEISGIAVVDKFKRHLYSFESTDYSLEEILHRGTDYEKIENEPQDDTYNDS